MRQLNLQKALDEARSAKVSDADTVIVPRWALELGGGGYIVPPPWKRNRSI